MQNLWVEEKAFENEELHGCIWTSESQYLKTMQYEITLSLIKFEIKAKNEINKPNANHIIIIPWVCVLNFFIW